MSQVFSRDDELFEKFDRMGEAWVDQQLIACSFNEHEEENVSLWLEEKRRTETEAGLAAANDPKVRRSFERLGEGEVRARMVHGRLPEQSARNAIYWLARKSGGGVHERNQLSLTVALGFAKREGREKWLKDHPLLHMLDRLGAWRFNRGQAVGMPPFANIRVRPMSAFDPNDKHLFPRGLT